MSENVRVACGGPMGYLMGIVFALVSLLFARSKFGPVRAPIYFGDDC